MWGRGIIKPSPAQIFNPQNCEIVRKVAHGSQKVEATHVSPDRWMNKQKMLYTHNRILFNLKK